MVLFLRNKRFNFMLFWGDYCLRWWRLPIEERACRKTDLGGGDYYLRNSGLPPSFKSFLTFHDYWNTIYPFSDFGAVRCIFAGGQRVLF